MKKQLAIALALTQLAMLSACGQKDPGVSEGTDTEPVTTAAEQTGYPYYGDTDFGGKTFKVLNVRKNLYNMICVIQPDELNGETINDLIYNRNERVKQKLNCEIEERNDDNISTYDAELHNILAKTIMAGEKTYDAAYMKLNLIAPGLTEGYYHSLDGVDTVHLEESWWDGTMLEATSLAGENYFASSSAHLMGWDSLWCLFFNETMMDNLKLDYPYELVKDGKWTLDAMRTYTKQAANLNGADSFVKDNWSTGTSVFGSVSFGADIVRKFIYGVGGDFVDKDNDDMPQIAFTDESFVNACQTLGKFLSTPGEFLYADSESTPDTCYINYFENNRAMFLGAEVKVAQRLRTFDQSFGIVPFPMLDEDQEGYRSTPVTQLAVFTIPITNDEPEKVGLLFDALSYESDATVLDTYFGVLVEQKGLRNEESIEMLNIIKDTRSFDLAAVYSWGTSLESGLRTNILAGGDQVASIIESNRQTVESEIETTLKALNLN